MAVTEVLIVGGGIGGLTTALCLADMGCTVRVLERADEFAEIGAGLQLAPNATRVLDRLGVLDRVVALGVLPRRLVLRDAIDGGELTMLDLGEGFRRRYGGSYVVLHRSDLLTVLVEACQKRGVGLETGKHVIDIDQTASEAKLWCADGTSYGGIAVIGADGLRSTVRAHFSDDEPICSGYVAYRGAVPADQVDATIDPDDVVAWVGPGVHLVQYALRGGAMVHQVAVFRSERYAELVAAGTQPTEDEWGGPDELAHAFSRTGSYMQQCLNDLWHDKRWPMYDRAPLTSWVDGRIALLGDAASQRTCLGRHLACGRGGQTAAQRAAARSPLGGLPARRLALRVGSRVPAVTPRQP